MNQDQTTQSLGTGLWSSGRGAFLETQCPLLQQLLSWILKAELQVSAKEPFWFRTLSLAPAPLLIWKACRCSNHGVIQDHHAGVKLYGASEKHSLEQHLPQVCVRCSSLPWWGILKQDEGGKATLNDSSAASSQVPIVSQAVFSGCSCWKVFTESGMLGSPRCSGYPKRCSGSPKSQPWGRFP